ncbi:MAG TPA: nuclear transport factor 2 family protein [Candidatus Baltobacteraceae bacterium]|nr:nuclear transport factor 2 family protein [Candidatus Baltobacteraceae bacterium]
MGIPKNTAVSLGVIALTFFAGLVANSSCAQTPHPQGKLTEAQVLALQRKFQAASVAADLPALSTLMADNATFIHGNGVVQTKAEYINALTSGQMKLTAYNLKESKVTFFKDGALVVAVTDVGLAPPRNGARGTPPRTLHLRVSTVWLRKLDGWQLILNQGTPLAPPSR